ncbi:transcriptional regulator, GntR family [Hungatella hathewayi DSM 13479]|uniref:Transcriptional regulator, GntR family n=1 Tax=Hungatella hathewayi DSM 13479 TaxID=566550 RepID=D3A9L7_9FIRM|nr:transcriptional regulator, GntR family [Hungatella hathewayi DSM 13479]
MIHYLLELEESVLDNSTELRQVVYSVLLTQIQFGFYRYGEKLPAIEETSTRLCVSVDTARAAYLKLKTRGYITLIKNAGATVKVKYDSRETEQFIQTFFSARKHAMIDLGKSLQPLFGTAQWTGLKYAAPEDLQTMELLFSKEDAASPYAILEHLNLKYRALGNHILMRLVWQSFMFLHNPFFSLRDNLRYFDRDADYLSAVLVFCREKDWSALRAAVAGSIEKLPSALIRFYEDRITTPPPEAETPFVWSSYKKSRQLCYSLAMELLTSISLGQYPVGSLLPSQEELARQKGVSVSTVRRALLLLDSIGAIKSAKYIGTRVLPFDKTAENSDFTRPVLQRRLMDMAESLQILALSCQAVSQLTLSSLNTTFVEQLCRDLKAHRQRRRGETLSYFLLGLIGNHAPYQTIRTVYTELLRQIFWAHAFHGMKGSADTIHAIYDPYYDTFIDSLEHLNFLRFSVTLEALILFELRCTVDYLLHFNVPGAENILVPDSSFR